MTHLNLHNHLPKPPSEVAGLFELQEIPNCPSACQRHICKPGKAPAEFTSH